VVCVGDVVMGFEGVVEALRRPVGKVSRLGRFVGRTLGSYLVGPEVVTSCGELEPYCTQLASSITALGHHVMRLLRVHQRAIVDRQVLVARIADAATELYVSTCVLRRLDHMLRHAPAHAERLEIDAGKLYLRLAQRRIRSSLAALTENDDDATLQHARTLLQ